MRRHMGVVAVAVCLFAAPVLAQTLIQDEVIESFEGPFDQSTTVGNIPSLPWVWPGYGPPIYITEEMGITTDGAKAFRINLPLNDVEDPAGVAALAWNVDIDDLTDFPIDWSHTVTIEIDVHGDDRSVTTDSSVGKWETFVAVNSYTRDAFNPVEWGDDGQQNGTTTTVSVVLSAGQGANEEGALHFGVAFEFDANDLALTETNAAIFDKLRITYYTPGILCSHDPVFDLTSVGDPGQPDGAVDELDTVAFRNCVTGPAASPAAFDALSTECKCTDINEDNSVDMKDFAGFQRCLGLSGTAAEACDD